MDVVVRATVVFFLLFVLLRVMGKRQLGQMTPFEFVGLIVLGDFVQQAVTHNDFSVTAAAIAVSTFGFWSLVLGWLSHRSSRLRRLFESEPRIVIRDGKMITSLLDRDKISPAEVLSEMRLAGIASIDQVGWGILEPNGRISFLERDGTRSDAAD